MMKLPERLNPFQNRSSNTCRLEVSTGPKFPARPANFSFGPARPAINILQNLYYGFKKFSEDGLFVKYGYKLQFNQCKFTIAGFIVKLSKQILLLELIKILKLIINFKKFAIFKIF